jgi:hypothetical protein
MKDPARYFSIATPSLAPRQQPRRRRSGTLLDGGCILFVLHEQPTHGGSLGHEASRSQDVPAAHVTKDDGK